MIEEKRINESQLKEVVGLFQSDKMLLKLDADDVKAVLFGTEGMLYQANQAEDVDNRTFMRSFFNELLKKPEVKSGTTLLLSIGMSTDNPLVMDDMEIVSHFLDSLEDENLDVKWGLKNNNEGSRMTLLAVCAR